MDGRMVGRKGGGQKHRSNKWLFLKSIVQDRNTEGHVQIKQIKKTDR